MRRSVGVDFVIFKFVVRIFLDLFLVFFVSKNRIF